MKKIKLLVMDVDGTLTDGKIYIGADGEVMKAFNVKDGYAIHVLLPENNITPVIITGRKSKIVENRSSELGVELVYQGISEKLTLLREIAFTNKVEMAEVAYIGDDINDIECLKACGYSGCPADAADEVRKCVNYVCKKAGGAGAVREFIAIIIERNKGIG